MYPYELFWGLTLYDILLGLSAIAAMGLFAFFSNKRKLSARYHNFILCDAVASIFVGYLVSVLFQALWNWLGGDNLEVTENTGATFLGGLIGGAGCFLAFYYLVGHFVFKDGEHIRLMKPMLDVFAPCIPAAHAVGRIGCLCAGCCYGRRTDAWYGITMADLGYKVIPVQLFESLFLFALTGFLVWRVLKNKRGNLPLYMAAYGVWRFFAEYLRDDDRGASIISFFTPSQFISVLLVLGAIALWLILYPPKPAKKAA